MVWCTTRRLCTGPWAWRLTDTVTSGHAAASVTIKVCAVALRDGYGTSDFGPYNHARRRSRPAGAAARHRAFLQDPYRQNLPRPLPSEHFRHDAAYPVLHRVGPARVVRDSSLLPRLSLLQAQEEPHRRAARVF